MPPKPPASPYVSLSQRAREEWQAAMSDVEPYLQAFSELPLPASQHKITRESTQPRAIIPRLPARPAGKKPLPELKQGTQDGVHNAQWRALRRGKLAIDATLDLHGQSQQSAYDALVRQIAFSLCSGHRLLLVITGRGSVSQHGVLREALPRWLNDEALRPSVLAFDVARAEDGGSGAYYVLLKKRSD